MAHQIQCGKCGGTGTLNAFLHIQGGQCFTCKGEGHFVISDRAMQARKRKAKKLEEQRVQDNIKADARTASNLELIANSTLLGPETLAACDNHSMFASDVASTLRKIQEGKLTKAKHPWIFQNLSR